MALALGCACGLSCSGAHPDAAPADIVVDVPALGVSVPRCMPLPDGADGVFTLTPTSEGGRAIVAQECTIGPWSAEGSRAAFLLPAVLTGHEVSLSRGSFGDLAPDEFRLEEADNTYLRLFDGDAPVLTYNFAKLLAAGVPEQFRRSSYVHPLFGLDGEVVSDDFPADHYHHRGLYWAWPFVEIAGKAYDLWMCAGIEPRFDRWLDREVGPVCAVFGANNGWYVGDREVVDETVWYRVWQADERGRAIDVDVTWEALGNPVTLTGATGKGYGGFCLRFAPREDTVITTSSGRATEDGLDVPAEWADLSAHLQGAPGTSGAAIFVHPGNPGFPNGWLLRHYGFLGCDWPGLKPGAIEPGRPVHVRYRVYVHRGDADGGKVAEAYRAFQVVADE